MQQPFTKCPSFDSCSSQDCPLDIYQDRRTKLPGEPKCVATKRSRVMLGQGLPLRGFFKREYQMILRHYGSVDAYILHLNEKKGSNSIGKKDKTSAKGSDNPSSMKREVFDAEN